MLNKAAIKLFYKSKIMSKLKVVGTSNPEDLQTVNSRRLKQIKEEFKNEKLEFYLSPKNTTIDNLSPDDLLYLGESFLINENKIIDWKLINPKDYYEFFNEKIEQSLIIIIVI